MRIFGIDYGSARIGIALGDTETRLAGPYRVIDVAKEDVFDALRACSQQEGIDHFVVGVPKLLRHPEHQTQQARDILEFIERLRTYGYTVHEEDESLSTAQAAIYSRQAGYKEKRDDMAAYVLLQSYLDRQA